MATASSNILFPVRRCGRRLSDQRRRKKLQHRLQADVATTHVVYILMQNAIIYRVVQKKTYIFQCNISMEPFKIKGNRFHQNVLRVCENKVCSFYAVVEYSLQISSVLFSQFSRLTRWLTNRWLVSVSEPGIESPFPKSLSHFGTLCKNELNLHALYSGLHSGVTL